MTSALPLVLIPAFGCDERLYADVLPALSRQRLVQTIVTAAPRIAPMVQQLLAQAPPEFVVLGTSMGARVALEAVLAAPGRVKGLVMIGASAGATADPAMGLRRAARIASGERDQVIDEMAAMIAHAQGPRGVHTCEMFKTMGKSADVEKLRQQADSLAHREDLFSRVREVACPVLCIWGEHDQFSPASDGRKLAVAVQRGVYHGLPDCGHFPTLEYPSLTVEAVAQFLAAAPTSVELQPTHC